MKIKCIKTNTGDLVVGKIYTTEWSEKVCGDEMYAVKDETGEYYLYPPGFFEVVAKTNEDNKG